jgi:hypothetical protein
VVPTPEPKLLDLVRRTARLKHFSLCTERAYAQWVYRFVVHNGNRHPREMGAGEIQAFLTSLAIERNVAASTQNQALRAQLLHDMRQRWMTRGGAASRKKGSHGRRGGQ